MRMHRHFIIAVAIVGLAACGSETDDSGNGTTDSGSSSGATDSGSSSGASDAGSSSGGAADAGSSGAATDAGSSSGGSADAGASSGAADAGGSGGAADAGAAIPKWADLKGKEKTDFMKNHMMPAMAAILKKADPKKFPEIKCTHCHGADGFKKNWKMPNGIKPLDPKNMPPKGKWPVADAMYNEVMPKLSKLLGKAPGKEFTCFNCHGKK